jgi:hypothetical protein
MFTENRFGSDFFSQNIFFMQHLRHESVLRSTKLEMFNLREILTGIQ